MPNSVDLIPDNAYSSQVKRVIITESDGIQKLTGVTTSVIAGGNITLDLDISPRNRCFIVFYDIVASASTNFDVELYPSSSYTSNSQLMRDVNNNLTMKSRPQGLGDFYEDEDSTAKLHLKITNNDLVNASTFTYKIHYKA